MATQDPNHRSTGPSMQPTAGSTAPLRRAIQPLRGLMWRFRRYPGQSVLILGGAMLAIIGLGFGLAYVRDTNSQAQSKWIVDQALEQLDLGNFPAARRIASELRTSNELSFEELGGPVYVLGVTIAWEAQEHWNDDERKKLYLIASRYLEEARERGFPANRSTHGMYLLGKSLFMSGRYAQSIPVLNEVLQTSPDGHSEIYKYLSLAHHRQEPPQLRQALQYNQKYLATTDIPLNDRLDSLLDQSRIHLRLGDVDASRKALDSILLTAEQNKPQLQRLAPIMAEAMVMQGQLFMHQADQLLQQTPPGGGQEQQAEAQRLYAAARDTFRQAQLKELQSSKSEYLLGVCFRKLGELPAAEKQFEAARRRFYATAEGFAAAAQEAEIRQLQGKYEQATASYLNLLREAGRAEDYRNPWIPLADFRQQVSDAYDQAIGDRRFEHANQLVTSLYPVFSRDDAMRLQAETHAAWGNHLLTEAAGLAIREAQLKRAEAYDHFRTAGRTFARLADLHITTRQYTDHLWRSAENYLNSHNYASVVRIMTRYLQNEPRRRRPRALTVMGQAKLSLDQVDDALLPLLECIEFHARHPASYQARLIASRAYLEKGHLSEAKALLIDNLENEELTPRSLEWRDSLFELGKVLYLEGLRLEANSRRVGVDDVWSPETRKEGIKELEKSSKVFAQCIRRLRQALRRKAYQGAPQTVEAWYMLAEAHRHRAKLPRKSLPLESIETTRVELNRLMQTELEAAIETYKTLQDLLNRRQDAAELSEIEARVLRNCYFAQAHALFDLGKYQDAIKAYSSATNRYQNEPASLEAYVQIAACYRRLSDPVKARGTLEQAKVVLQRIGEDADFGETTRFDSHTRWREVLDWLSSI